MHAIWKTIVLKKEIVPETNPLLNAVNIEEIKIENPVKANENENI